MRLRGTAALAALALVLAGCSASAEPAEPPRWQAGPAPVITSDAPSPTRSPSPRPSPTPKPSRSPSAKPSPSASRTPSRPAPLVMSTYGVAFTIAPGSSTVVGPSGGTLRRYQVAVEKGLSESPSTVAATVERILGNTERGWTRSGSWRFQRVSSGSFDFVVELASPASTDLICGKYGLYPNGQVSCRGGKNVVINVTRWRLGTNGTTAGAVAYAPATYRALVVNHEVGHALGKGHVGCPGADRPAPVMMTQYFGIDGCLPNVWPYAADGTYLTGPLVS